MKRYLEIGKVVNVHGIRGDLKVLPWCDDPSFLCSFETLYLRNGAMPVHVTEARYHKDMAVLHLEGFDTPEQAEKLRGQILYMDRSEVQLESGTYFVQDLIGLEVRNADTGKCYGILTDVLQTGANDVYEITPERGKRLLIPAIPDVILKTDVLGGVMEIRPLEGLLDED